MGSKDFKKKKSNWILRPTLGLGDISLGDNVLDWSNFLSMEFKGDYYTQMKGYLNEEDEGIKNFVGRDFLYDSNEFDLQLYSEDNVSITTITAGEYCIFEGVDLINAKISKITSLWGLPSTVYPDPLGLDFFYEEIGLNVRFDEYRRVAWINISAPYED